jgi:glycine/D-amino acid oxidase-like deaminating enzyme
MTAPLLSVDLPSSVPVTHEAEIVVMGGGPGGLGAAIAAAREGRKTLLIEHYGFLGGMATAGEVNPFMPNQLGKTSLDCGIFTEWCERMAEYQGISGRTFDPIVARLAAEDLCIEAGVKLLFHHRTAHVQVKEQRIKAIVLHSKSGLSAVRAERFIDCTGDGDLAAMAGAPFELGGEGTEHVQPMTLCFKLRLDPEEVGDAPEKFWGWGTEANKQIQEIYARFQQEGETSNPRENVLMFSGMDPYIVHFNSTRVIHKLSTVGSDLSDAEVEGRKQMRELVKMLREQIPGFKNAKIHSVATQIGIRESRRILGQKYLTRQDYIDQAKFDDGIARVNYPVDIHNPDGSGTEMTHLPKGAWYEIPYGCIVPRDIENLLMGCRAISVDHALHSSMRVMPPVVSIGQAAGTAAAMSLEKTCSPAEVDGCELVERLIQRGRNLVHSKETIAIDDKEAERLERVNMKRPKIMSS